MDWERRCLRLCGAILLCAVGLRLASGGALTPLVRALDHPEAASFLIYLHTGRVVRMGQTPVLPTEPEPPETVPESTAPTVAVETLTFDTGDAALVGVTYNCGLRPDLESLLTQPLEWNLRSGKPSVLILHTHTTESYTKTEQDLYTESSPYRTLEPDHNMLAVGDLVAELLEEAGIAVIHDQIFHDYPSYNGSYDHAAAATREILAEYPSIQLILDLHRDAADTAYGQMVTQCSVGGETSAQLMMVVGTDAGPLDHPDWERNLALALKLQVLLETENPGICRDLNLTAQRYNQHLGNLALLIEVGAAGNTMAEAKLAAVQLAEAIIRLAEGSA